MWNNRDYYNGLSVLPYDGGTHKQAPFETITKERYEELVQGLDNIDLTQVIELEDNTNLQGELACAGGACETGHMKTIDRLMSDGKWRTAHDIVSDMIDLLLLKDGKVKTESKRRKGRTMIPTRAQIFWYFNGNKNYEMRNEKVKEWRMKNILYIE